jgi:hypothetical protein
LTITHGNVFKTLIQNIAIQNRHQKENCKKEAQIDATKPKKEFHKKQDLSNSGSGSLYSRPEKGS